MDTTTHGHGMTVGTFAPEFGAWPVEGVSIETVNLIRSEFDKLQALIAGAIPSGNGRYLALVKTNLELANFYAIKGVAKPLGN